MPATLVLNGVTSPRTYASSVTCSTLPPSHSFQLRVMVMKTARASATTRSGVTYFFHPTLLRETAAGLSLSGGSDFVSGAADLAGTGEVDIKFAPSVARNLQSLRHSRSYTQKRSALFVSRPRTRCLSKKQFQS